MTLNVYHPQGGKSRNKFHEKEQQKKKIKTGVNEEQSEYIRNPQCKDIYWKNK